MPSLSRRSLLPAASVIGATAAVSAAATTASAAETGMSGKAGPRDETYDIVIVGSGCAGLSAAIEAGDLGAKAVVIEKMPRPMGNTIYAGGNFNATCTWVQKKAGVTDTVDAFYKDMMMVSRGRGDPKLTRMFCEQSAGVVQWVTDRCHMTWKPLDIQIAPMLARCHEVAGKLQPGGSQLTRNMMEEVKKLSVPVLFNTKVIELLHDDKLKCTGVRVLDKNGSRNIYTKGGVILCTGGFHANKGMVTQYISGSAAWMPLRGSNCCTGENVTLTAPFFPSGRPRRALGRPRRPGPLADSPAPSRPHCHARPTGRPAAQFPPKRPARPARRALQRRTSGPRAAPSAVHRLAVRNPGPLRPYGNRLRRRSGMPGPQ